MKMEKSYDCTTSDISNGRNSFCTSRLRLRSYNTLIRCIEDIWHNIKSINNNLLELGLKESEPILFDFYSMLVSCKEKLTHENACTLVKSLVISFGKTDDEIYCAFINNRSAQESIKKKQKKIDSIESMMKKIAIYIKQIEICERYVDMEACTISELSKKLDEILVRLDKKIEETLPSGIKIKDFIDNFFHCGKVVRELDNAVSGKCAVFPSIGDMKITRLIVVSQYLEDFRNTFKSDNCQSDDFINYVLGAGRLPFLLKVIEKVDQCISQDCKDAEVRYIVKDLEVYFPWIKEDYDSFKSRNANVWEVLKIDINLPKSNLDCFNGSGIANTDPLNKQANEVFYS